MSGVGAEILRVHFVCCRQDNSGEIGLLRELMADSRTSRCEEVADPGEADLILIAGILEKDTFKNLRLNDVWKQYPEKSFGYGETDNVPSFLHGVYSSATRAKGVLHRIQSCGYMAHNAWRQNPCTLAMPFYQQPKKYLFSFIGRNSHPVRKRLFQVSWPGGDVVVEDTTTSYEYFTDCGQKHQEMQAHFWKILSQSKFALCPRGAGASSIRLFEAMHAGVAPVIFSDAWIPPAGPDWKKFAIFIPEHEIGRTHEILKSHESEWEERGKIAAAAYQQWFAHGEAWRQLLAAIEEIRFSQKIPEKWFVRARHFIYCFERLHEGRYQLQIKLAVAFRQMKSLITGSKNGRKAGGETYC
jgi:hypothetical protein